jgi:hypothetical protein
MIKIPHQIEASSRIAITALPDQPAKTLRPEKSTTHPSAFLPEARFFNLFQDHPGGAICQDCFDGRVAF